MPTPSGKKLVPRSLSMDALSRLVSLAQLEKRPDRTSGQQQEMYELRALQAQLESAADEYLGLGRRGRPRALAYPILSPAALAERRSHEVLMSHLLDELSSNSTSARKRRPGLRYCLAGVS